MNKPAQVTDGPQGCCCYHVCKQHNLSPRLFGVWTDLLRRALPNVSERAFPTGHTLVLRPGQVFVEPTEDLISLQTLQSLRYVTLGKLFDVDGYLVTINEKMIYPCLENVSTHLDNIYTFRYLNAFRYLNTSNKSRKLSYSQEDIQTARTMFDYILRLNPNHKSPNFEKWADVIRRMRERDHHSISEILELFLWANSHEFWSSNILSPKSLRDKWDRLAIQRKTEKRKKSAAALLGESTEDVFDA